jgi:hypothetical protein
MNEVPTSGLPSEQEPGARAAVVQDPKPAAPQQQEVFDPPSPGEISSFDFLESSTNEINRAAESNDFRTVDRLMDAQLSEVMQGLVLEDFGTGRTGNVMTRRMTGAHPEVNLAAVSMQIVRRNMEMDDVLAANGWQALEAKGNEIVRLYKERNGADKVEVRAGMTPEEMFQASQQFEPVMVDPNEIAEFRQQLQQLDAKLRPLGTSVWTDPRTSRIANILQTSAEPGRAGYLADSEQNINDQLGGFTKYVGLPVVEGIDAFVGTAAQVGVGARDILHRLGVVSLDGLTQGNTEAVYNAPTSWVQDQDGQWYHNGGKVGAVELYAGIWYSLTGELIDQQMAEYADTKARAAMQASGIQGLNVGLGQFMGSMAGFLGTGGPAMKAGGLLTKGLGVAVTGGKAAQSLSRTTKIVSILAERSGAAAALGAMEAVKSGRVEGYGAATLHGTIMAVPMMVMGAMGDRLERTLRRYKSLPGPVAAGLAGTVEGIGLDLGTWEAGWQFVKDPSDETFSNLAQQVLVNAVGNGLLRGSGITGAPPAHEFALPPDVQRQRKQERRARAAGTEPLEVAAERGAAPETAQALGEAETIRRQAVGVEPEVAMAATRTVREAEQRMDVEEAGLAKTESEKLNERRVAKDRLDAIASIEATPESRAEATRVLEQSRLAFGKDFPQVVRDRARALKDDGSMVEQLLGKKAAADFRDSNLSLGQLKDEFKALAEKQRNPETRLTPEERQRMIRLLDLANKRAAIDVPRGIAKVADRMRQDFDAGNEAQREMLEAGAVVKALLGREGGPTTTDIVTARNKELAKQGITLPERAELQAQRAKEGGEDAELAAMAKKLGMSVEQLRAEMGEPETTAQRVEPTPSGRVTEQVPGREPGPIRPVADKGSPESQMVQEGGREGLEPDRPAPPDRGKERAPRPLSPEEELLRGVAEAKAPPARGPGTPASLRMQPSLEQEGVPGTKPIRASDVLKEMAGFDGDPVRAPMRKGVGMRGRMSTKGVLGWYSLHEDIVRLKGARDLVVAAHEWSHAMDLATGATKNLRALTPAEADGFIKAAHPYYPGYDKLPKRSQMMESWAEFWARHMLDDPTLKEETGAFHDFAMNWIADPKRAGVLKQMQRIQAALRQYRDQGAVSRVRQTAVLESDRESVQDLKARGVMEDTTFARAKAAVRKAWDVLMRTAVDDVHELKKAQERWLTIAKGSKEKAIAALQEMDITANPTRLYDALRMTASKQAEAFLAIGTHDLAGNQTGESLRDVFADIGKDRYEDFITYLIAKRSLEVRDKGLPTQLARDDYLTTIEKLENPDFVKGAQRIRAWSDRLIDFAVEGGLFSKKQGEQIKGSYKTYIPFQRVLEGPEQHAPGRGVAERGTGVKSMKGGQEEIRDPVNALGDMARNVIAKTHQAMVMKAMVKFGIVNRGVGGFITEVKRTVIPKDHPMFEIAEAIRRAGTPSGPDAEFTIQTLTKTLEDMAAAGELGASITLFGQQTIPRGSRPIIAYTPHFTEAELADMTPAQQRLAKHKDGRLLWLEVDVNAYEALMGIDVPQTILDKLPDVVRNVVEAPTKLIRAGATVLSPGFALRNTIRDVAGDYVYTSDANKSWLFSGVTRFARGMIEQRGDTQAARLFDALGGGVSTFFSGEVAAGRTSREMLNLHRGWWQRARHAMGAYGDWLARNTEQPLRTEAFARTRETALSEGKSELQANLLALEAAKEVTINFARGGTISRAINRLVPYFNAGIQGNRKFFMTLAGKSGDVAKRNAWLRAITGITVPTIALWALNQDEEWYQELPEWRRFNYWNFKLPGLNEIVSIPKPFELGKMFGNVPEIMLDQLAVENPIAVTDAVKDSVISLVPQVPIPAIMKPLVEVATNHDFFTGRDVVPEWLQASRMPEDQRTAYTRWFGDVGAGMARALGMDPSPMVVEHLVDAYTGGMAGRLSDSLSSAGGVASIFSGQGPRDLPVVGTLFRQGAFEQSRSVQRIFDLDAEFTRMAGSDQLEPEQKAARRQVSQAKDQIADLKAQARAGTISRAEADQRAMEIARETLERID